MYIADVVEGGRTPTGSTTGEKTDEDPPRLNVICSALALMGCVFFCWRI